MLKDRPIRVSIPVGDMAQAKRFYTEKLSLGLLFENEFATVFAMRDSQIALVPSQDVTRATYSLVTWMVEDIQAQVAALRQAGIEFEDYEIDGLKTVDGVAQFDDDFVAWFKDSEGNLLALAELHDA